MIRAALFLSPNPNLSMSRTPNTKRAPSESAEILPAAVTAVEAGQALHVATEEAARALAVQLSYEGSLTVGALEDEIRFYQKQSVVALLEAGKRLLLLKELTPHGEFTQRVEMLGFSVRSAQRFMQAAAKVSKSATVALLATEVKNAKAFLELVTHDDDVIEAAVKDLDNIDRMSASELRAALREAQAESEAQNQLLAEKNKALDKAKAAARRIANAPAEEQIAAELQELATRFHTALAYVRGDLRLGFQKLFERESAGDAEPGSHRQVMAGYVREIEHELAVLKSDFFLLDLPTQATE